MAQNALGTGPVLALALFWLAAWPSPSNAQLPVQAAPSSASRAEALRFDMLAFNVRGNTVLSVDEIETAVYGFLGPDKGLADAEAARAALERAYQSRGFLSVVVTLPPQQVNQGELTLEVIEAQVAQRRITGSQYHLPSVIAEKTPSLAPGSVPNFEDMQSELSRVQATPDLKLTPVITPAEDPRKLGIELKVQDQLPLHASVELNSKQSFNTDRGRLEAALRYDNLFQRGHSLGVNWNVAPTNTSQANTWVVTYALPWAPTLPWHSRTPLDGPADDGRLSLAWVHSGSQTPTSLGGATVVKGDTLGLRWRTPLRSLDTALSHGLSLNADFKSNLDSSRSVTGESTDNPGLRYGTLSLGYDLYASSPEGVRNSLDASLVLGLPGLTARQVACSSVQTLDQFECKRAGASARFQVLRLNASQQRALFGRWELTLQAQLQLTPQPLVSGEQFGAGGQGSVRGYYEYEQVGDQGLSWRAELATPPWLASGNYGLHAVGFLEGAALRVNQALPAEQSRIDMASVGFGLRLRAPAGLQARLDLAVPLRDTLKADSSGTLVPASGRSSRNERRWDLSVRYDF